MEQVLIQVVVQTVIAWLFGGNGGDGGACAA